MYYGRASTCGYNPFLAPTKISYSMHAAEKDGGAAGEECVVKEIEAKGSLFGYYTYVHT